MTIHINPNGGTLDPDATFEIVQDVGRDLIERMTAALELSRWLWNGGFPPAAARVDQVQRLRTLNVKAYELLDVLMP